VDYDVQAWESFGDGWVNDSFPPVGDPDLTNLARSSDGTVSFTGSNLVGTYRTRNNLTGLRAVNQALRPVMAFAEAAFDADQIHPAIWGEEGEAVGFWEGERDDATWEGPRSDRWTWEGPTYTQGSEEAITVKLQWRRSIDGTSWTHGWTDFEPGLYPLVQAQFRVRFTRPSDGWDIILRRLHTRIRIPRTSSMDHDDRRGYLEGEVF
jgi:hypothetical protein